MYIVPGMPILLIGRFTSNIDLTSYLLGHTAPSKPAAVTPRQQVHATLAQSTKNRRTN